MCVRMLKFIKPAYGYEIYYQIHECDFTKANGPYILDEIVKLSKILRSHGTTRANEQARERKEKAWERAPKTMEIYNERRLDVQMFLRRLNTTLKCVNVSRGA